MKNSFDIKRILMVRKEQKHLYDVLYRAKQVCPQWEKMLSLQWPNMHWNPSLPGQ